MDELPELYLKGIWLFNEGEFFDCHDELEELWTEIQGEERKYIQGLIQAAVALFHFGNGNLGGAGFWLSLRIPRHAAPGYRAGTAGARVRPRAWAAL